MANDKVNLHQLKAMPPHELLAYAEKVGVDNPSALKKQNMLFAILKSLAEKNILIEGGGVLETLQDGFGFLLLKTDGVINWSENWLYFKFLVVFLMLIAHYLLSKYRIDFYMDNNKRSKKFYKILNEIPTVLLIIIILLVYLKPF